MAFEFVAKKGFITPGNATVSGSMSVYGGITGSFTGSHTGNVTGTASFAVSASTTTGTSSYALTSSFATTSSFGLSGNINDYGTYIGSKVPLIVTSSAGNLSGIRLTGSNNNFLEINVLNASSQATASSDIVATNNLGGDGGFYTDMGINGSSYSASMQLIGAANDGYFYHTGSQFYIGNVTPSGQLYLFAGGGFATTSSIAISSTNVSSSVPITASGFYGTGSYAISSSFSITSSFSTSGSYSLSSSYALTSPTSSYSATSSMGARAYGIFSCLGTALTNNTSRGGVLTRNSAGQYSVIFSPVLAPTANYAVVANGWTASVAASVKQTASLCSVFGQTTAGFTMSFTPAGLASSSVGTDVVTASYATFFFGV
jgi:hypothetical protein